MKRLFSRNAKLALSALPIAIGCALAQQGDPPLPVPDPNGDGGEATGGTSTGGTGTGGTGTGGASGSTSGTSGAGMTGGTSGAGMTGGASGSGMTGGSAGKGGSAGTSAGGTAGSAAGSAGKGGTAGTMTGGTGGSMAGGAGKGGTAGTGGKGGSGGGGAGGPPSGMDLLRDNFEMGTSNWTATPGPNWATAMDGTTVYAATGATASSTPWRAAYAGETTWTDVDITARVKITNFPGSSSSYYAGICARYASNSTYACFTLRSNGQVSFRVNGNNTTAWSPPSAITDTPPTWYTVRVVARGANLTGYLNGTEIPAGSRVTSGAPASGRVALAAPGTDAVFDDIVVTTP